MGLVILQGSFAGRGLRRASARLGYDHAAAWTARLESAAPARQPGVLP